MNDKEKFLNDKELNENKKINDLNDLKKDNFVKKELNELKPTKKELIEEINNNFRTILSYGTANELVPAGQFIVKDIVMDPATHSKNLILEQLNNPSVNLVIPKEIFQEYVKMAIKNSKRLKIDETPVINPADRKIQSISTELISDEFLTDLQEAEVLPLEENGITLIRDGFVTPANYSICPIHIEPLQKYLEKERISEPNSKKPNKDFEQENLNKKFNLNEELELPGAILPGQTLKPMELEPRPFREDEILSAVKKEQEEDLER